MQALVNVMRTQIISAVGDKLKPTLSWKGGNQRFQGKTLDSRQPQQIRLGHLVLIQ